MNNTLKSEKHTNNQNKRKQEEVETRIEIDDMQWDNSEESEELCKDENDEKSKLTVNRRCTSTRKRKITTNDREDDMFIAELINAVYHREPLWNSTLPHDKRGHKLTSSLWAEIDQQFHLAPGESQIKFKSLRDRFVRLAGEKRQSKDNEITEPPTWKYYDSLKFLQPTIIYRTTTSSLKKRIRIESCDSPIQNVGNADIENTELIPEARVNNLSDEQSTQENRSDSATMNYNQMSPFELYCMKQLEILNKPSDQISTFCAYLESELRTLSYQKMENVKENIMYLILQAKKGHIK